MNFVLHLTSTTVEQFAEYGPGLAVKSTLLLAGALWAHALLRRRQVLLCSALWNAWLVALLVLFAMPWAGPAIEIPIAWASGKEPPIAESQLGPPNSNPAPAAELQHSAGRDGASPSKTIATLPATSTDSKRRDPEIAMSHHAPATTTPAVQFGEQQTFNWRSALVVVYLAGVLVCLLRLVLNLLAVRRLRNRSTSIGNEDWESRLAHWSNRLGVQRKVTLLASDHVAVPVVLGWLRPAIILPRILLSDLNGARRDAVLIHELAHVRRGDYAWQFPLLFSQAIYWPQPLVWLAGRCIGRLRERACDDVCIHALGGRDEYRATLLDLAAALVRPHRLSLGMAAVQSSKIARRLAAIDTSAGSERCQAPRAARWSSVIGLVLLGCFAGAANLVAPSAGASTQDDSRPKVAAKPTEELVVTVVDNSGKPVPSVEVHAFRAWSTGPFQPEKSFTTDEQGRIQVPHRWTEEENDYQLVARATANRLGYLNLRRHQAPGAAKGANDAATLELRLMPCERAVRGRVVDETGRLLAGAMVGVRHLMANRGNSVAWWGEPQTSPLGHTVSLPGGSFSIAVPRTAHCEVVIAHRDYVAVHKDYRGTDDDLGIVQLRPGAILAGRAIEAASGRPVAGARIHASDQLDDRDEPVTGEVRYGMAITDADGRYEIPSLKPGAYNITFHSPEDRPKLTAVAQDRLPLEPGRKTTADFRVIEGHLLAGKVVDVDDGQPIADIQVVVNSPAFPRSSRGGHNHTRTDANGEFRFYLPPGECDVRIIEGENWQLPDSKRSVYLEADKQLSPIVLRAHSPKKVTWRGGAGFAKAIADVAAAPADKKPEPEEIVIRFRTSDGKPVGATITKVARHGGEPTMTMAHSGNEHRFPARYLGFPQPGRVPNDGGGATYYLLIDAQGYARPDPVAVRATDVGSPIFVDLKTPQIVSIRGRVVDPDGHPIANANVSVALAVIGDLIEKPWGAQYFTDSNGRFEIKHTYVGNRLSVHVTKDGWSGVISEPLTISEAEPIELGDLQMTEPNGVIEGRVVDVNDAGLPGILVTALPYKIQTRTDAKGNFRLTSLPVGEATLNIFDGEYESYPRKVAVGTKDILFKLFPKSPEDRPDVPMIRGKFRTADGKPVTATSNYWWFDIAGEPKLWMSATRNSGSFEFSNVWRHPLAKGKPQRLVIEVAGYKRPDAIEVATNKNVDLTIELEPAEKVPVGGRVMDEAGQPVAGATVWTTLKIRDTLYSDTWGPSATTDALGRFSLDHLNEGDEFKLHVGKPGFAGLVETASLSSANPLTFRELLLRPASARLTGVVLNREKKPVAGARVYTNYLGKIFEATTDANGKFTLSGLPNGEIMLSVEAETFRTNHRTDSNSKDVTIIERRDY